jgi:outer membrane translocation and assembly module TamA
VVSVQFEAIGMGDKKHKIVKLAERGPDGTVRFAAADPAGKILDDARGYGYRSPRAVHRGYNWKHRNLTYTRDVERENSA